MESDRELLAKARANNPTAAKMLWKRIAAGEVDSDVIVEWTGHVARRLVKEALDHKPENRRADRAWTALGVSGARTIDDKRLALQRDIEFLSRGRPISSLEIIKILQLDDGFPDATTQADLRKAAKKIDHMRKKRQ